MFDIDIKIKVSKGKMTYIFIDNGVEKTFSLLSAGEKTRVSLMLLLATLKTIEQLTNITINYLVLDELLGVLDGEGINFLKNVLSTMRKDKCIYIISHHNEIEDSFADGIITVIKENNISRIE
jgi:DNA repair exonuclease SbcCD ATPase subunit